MMKVLHLTRQSRWGGRALYFQALCLILALGIGSAAHAQEAGDVAEEELESMAMDDLLRTPVKVAAAASEEARDVFSSPSAVTVIDKATIKKFGFQNIAQALTIVPGMSVYRTYFRRNIPTSRGVTQFNYANKVLLMINGVPTWHAVSGESILDRISIHDLERIEVLKGPASVIYGSNAYAGAINLVLKEPAEFDDTDIEMEAKLGTEDVIEGNSRYIHHTEDTRLFVAAGGRKEDGAEDTYVDEFGTTGKYQEFIERAHATVEGQMGDHKLLVNAYNSQESYLGIIPAFVGGAGKDMVTTGYLVDYKFSPAVSEMTKLVLGATFDWNYVDFSRSLDNTLWGDFQGYRGVGYLRLDNRVSEQLNFSVGANYEHRESERQTFYLKREDSVQSFNNLKDRNLYEYSFFADVNYDAAPFLVTAGTRLTENELFGSDLSSRGALVFKINDTNSIKLMVGQSFRSPSFFELYLVSGIIEGNADLDPETSTAYELAYVGAFGDIFFQALAYYAEYDKKIFRNTETLADGSTQIIYRNGEEFSAFGGEIEARYLNPQLADIFVNYQIVEGDDGDEIPGTDNYNFKYVPQSTLAIGMAKNFGRAFSSMVFNYQTDAEGPVGSVDDTWTFDLQLGYDHQMSELTTFRHAIIAENIFDEDVVFAEYNRLRSVNEVPNGYGRRIMYTVSVTF